MADLAANTKKCVLAYWRIPLYSSSLDHQPDMQGTYQLLYTKGADQVLTGHAHFYCTSGSPGRTGRATPIR